MINQLTATYLQQLCDRENEPRVIIKAESPRFEIVVYNSWFAQISQTQGRELAGHSMAEIQSWNNKNEDAAIEIYDALIATIQTKAMVRLPVIRYDLTAPDGTIIPSWWRAIYEPLLNVEGKVAYLLCTVHRVTEEDTELIKPL